MKNKIRALAMSATAVVGTASAATIAAPVIKDGTYVIQVHRFDEDPRVHDRVAGCMIVSNNGRNSVPSLYSWGLGGSTWCGLSGRVEDVLQNRQAAWEITSVRASSGEQAYVIKSHVNGRCLIRGHNGHASAPTLHLWSGIGGDAKYCGFRSADELIDNGQAAWSFDAEPFGWALLVNSASTRSHGNAPPGIGYAPLAFATPRTYPNQDPNAAFATFTSAANPWFFVFWPTDY